MSKSFSQWQWRCCLLLSVVQQRVNAVVILILLSAICINNSFMVQLIATLCMHTVDRLSISRKRLRIVTEVICCRSYDAKMRRFKEKNGMLSEAWPALDKWELQRDQVVLNRRLGEGAFGTVYGGEALIDDCWVAVAVKTLKVGSNVEAKVTQALHYL